MKLSEAQIGTPVRVVNGGPLNDPRFIEMTGTVDSVDEDLGSIYIKPDQYPEGVVQFLFPEELEERPGDVPPKKETER